MDNVVLLVNCWLILPWMRTNEGGQASESHSRGLASLKIVSSILIFTSRELFLLWQYVSVRIAEPNGLSPRSTSIQIILFSNLTMLAFVEGKRRLSTPCHGDLTFAIV